MKNNKRIIIITDSVGLPRKEVSYEDTWVYMLKKDLPEYDFIERPSRGGTTERLVSEGGMGIDLLELYEPDIAIIQLGITDCAPRYFDKSKFEYKFINTLPAGLRNRYIDRVKKTRTRDPLLAYVSPEKFRENVSSYIERADKLDTLVKIIAIAKPSSLFTMKNPHIEKNVRLYNSIYSEVCDSSPNAVFIDPFKTCNNMDSLCVDELHINRSGAIMIHKSIMKSFCPSTLQSE